MELFINAFDSLLGVLRLVLFALAAALVVLCLVDWLVRTRRLSPFSPVARLMRSRIDPLLRPIERRVVRSGGLPQNAPWWALATVVLAGIVLLSLLGFVRSQISFIYFSVTHGPGAFVRLLIVWAFTVLQVALIVRVVLSWIPRRPGAWYWRWSYALTEPLLKPLRKFIPPIAMMDITPIVAWLLLGLLQGVLTRLV